MPPGSGICAVGLSGSPTWPLMLRSARAPEAALRTTVAARAAFSVVFTLVSLDCVLCNEEAPGRPDSHDGMALKKHGLCLQLQEGRVSVHVSCLSPLRAVADLVFSQLRLFTRQSVFASRGVSLA